MPLPVQVFNLQGAVEPMQIDVDPQEDQQNSPDINYVVENPTLVRALLRALRHSLSVASSFKGLEKVSLEKS
ncbi:hypothetical protein WISP_25062 [Willisornis vidua]|uniref:Uncharacterized protein n=1 Tax=Willisornis vidua TaxID=1566151 RepID=A0ABQ9DM23_9PASS|nr:hypothetical protein WISP_25062 [Willisornis vidua]